VALGLVVAAALVFVVNLCINGLGTLPGGYRPFVVLSGSMEPSMPTGSLVLTKSVDPETVRVGDVITFRLESGSFQTDSATHRVAAIEQGPGGLIFITKGDANQAPDPLPVPASALVGRVVAGSSLAGSLAQALKAPLFLSLVALGAVVLVADSLWRRTVRGGKRRRSAGPLPGMPVLTETLRRMG
jgi:signal peptidase